MSSRTGLMEPGYYTNKEEESCMNCKKTISSKMGTSIHVNKKDRYNSEWSELVGFVCSETCKKELCYNPWDYIPYES